MATKNIFSVIPGNIENELLESLAQIKAAILKKLLQKIGKQQRPVGTIKKNNEGVC